MSEDIPHGGPVHWGRIKAAQTTISGYRISGSSPLHDGYDEPEILRSSTRPICLKALTPDTSLRTTFQGADQSSLSEKIRLDLLIKLTGLHFLSGRHTCMPQSSGVYEWSNADVA